MTFIDLKKAFVSIDREVLFIALRDFGIPGDIISLIEALHTKPIGKLDKENTFVVNQGVRQGCVFGPLLFIIVFDFLLSKTSGEKRNFAYADDLALISDNHANGTKSLNEKAKTFGLAQLETSVGKTKSIVIKTKDNTNVPINVLSEQVEQVNHFEYLGSIIASDGIADKAISAPISKTRIAMLRLRPALVSERLTLRNKGLLIETFLKPVLLYGLETLVIRCTVLGRLEAVIRAKRMCLRLETRNEMKLKELNEKVKTTPVAYQLCRRRVQLYASFKNIGADSLTELLEGAKVWQKGWVRQLTADLDNHGLKTKCDQDNWLHNPTTKLKFTDGGDFKANAIGKRSQTVHCANENCGRKFHSKKEMYRHLRDNHSPSVQSSASSESEIETKGNE